MTHDNPPATQGAFKPADAAAWLSISRSQLYGCSNPVKSVLVGAEPDS